MGEIISETRRKSGLSIGQLAQLTGISKSALHRLEHNLLAVPEPARVERIAAALHVAPSDLYDDRTLPATILPKFGRYLRSKYRNLPPEAYRELEAAFDRVADKYGYVPEGPAPGEDER